MRRTLAWVTGALLLAGACATSGQQRQSFMGAVRGYNDDVRWQRPTHAAAFIPPAERDDFVDEREELSEDLRIDDYELSRVRMDRAGNRAEVQVKYTWHRDSKGLVHDTTTLQKWERRGKLWQLTEETRLRGEEMPGVPEPPEAEEPAETEPEAEEPAETEPEGPAPEPPEGVEPPGEAQ